MPPVSQRKRARPRCPGCGLVPDVCACALLPRMRLQTPLAIIQHARERVKPTNSGRLLARIVEDTTLIPHGVAGLPFDPGPLADPEVDWVLLYPKVDAPVLQPGRRVGLVLLDGTWNQAARMARRVPGMTTLPCATLPPGPPPLWTVRAQPREGGLSTFEAALRALEILEGPDATAPLRHAFELLTARFLFIKGLLPTPEVPVSWR